MEKEKKEVYEKLTEHLKGISALLRKEKPEELFVYPNGIVAYK